MSRAMKSWERIIESDKQFGSMSGIEGRRMQYSLCDDLYRNIGNVEVGRNVRI